jgi:hypothetical protein
MSAAEPQTDKSTMTDQQAKELVLLACTGVWTRIAFMDEGGNLLTLQTVRMSYVHLRKDRLTFIGFNGLLWAVDKANWYSCMRIEQEITAVLWTRPGIPAQGEIYHLE